MKRKWRILNPDKKLVENISKAVNCSPLIASLLVNRGIFSPKDAHDFLNISIDNIRHPFSMKDMDTAVNRIYKAIKYHEKILVFGDYDVDGVTSTALLMEFLRHTGADASYYIPHRTKEGYGLQKSHITGVAVPGRINLIITVDCGSSSHEAVKAALDAGIDTVITDHHMVPEKLPEAVAIINPKRSDCNSGFYDLAGVGVAFSLVICLRKYLRDRHFWESHPEPNLKNLCDLIALGTVADMVPLKGENRIFTKTGLDLINSGSRIGISALIKETGSNKYPFDSEDIAFRLAPRINALGRIDHAKEAVELLLSDDPGAAGKIARQMNMMNAKRQNIEKMIVKDILEYIDNNPDTLRHGSIVLSRQSWHEGVLGIVASKIVERFCCPVIIFAEKDGFAKGSGRSIPSFNLYEGLKSCSKVLEGFGGHSMAAGLSIKTENLGLFKNEFENQVMKMSLPEDSLTFISIDHEIGFNDIDANLVDEIEALKPFGAGNPEPVFLARNVTVVSSEIVGENHRRMILSQSFGLEDKIYNAIHFNFDQDLEENMHFEEMAFRLRWNRWNGNKSIQLVIENI
ncbi:MAG: single-stranded-DNA-specific exonuclease RecJ [Desulfobacteraceae bacterium]|nr:MAG: single-stranded-DNA-specific exonuclease RecJ [Desulfobacteraceae bacterium]